MNEEKLNKYYSFEIEAIRKRIIFIRKLYLWDIENMSYMLSIDNDLYKKYERRGTLIPLSFIYHVIKYFKLEANWVFFGTGNIFVTVSNKTLEENNYYDPFNPADNDLLAKELRKIKRKEKDPTMQMQRNTNDYYVK